jgi:hypothetical protein
MVAPITAGLSVNRGLCPHGLPFAACPICSGKGGGGGSTTRVARAGEMTWDECYSIGQIMKAQAQRTADAKQFADTSFMNTLQNNKTVQFLVNKAVVIANFIQTNIAQPVVNVANKVFTAITTPILNLADKIMNSAPMRFVLGVAENIQKGFTNITDKLAAVIGEPLNAMQDFIAENWKKLKPKKFIFFSAVDTEMEQGEQDEEVELKRWLHLRSLKENIHKIFKKRNKKEYAEWS